MDPLGPWRPLAGPRPGSASDGKAATCDTQAPLEDSPAATASRLVSFNPGGCHVGFLERFPCAGTWLPHAPRCWLIYFFILQTSKHRAEFTAPACPIVEPALNPFLTRLSETRAESLVRTSLAVQCLRLRASTAGGTGLIPG